MLADDGGPLKFVAYPRIEKSVGSNNEMMVKMMITNTHFGTGFLKSAADR